MLTLSFKFLDLVSSYMRSKKALKFKIFIFQVFIFTSKYVKIRPNMSILIRRLELTFQNPYKQKNRQLIKKCRRYGPFPRTPYFRLILAIYIGYYQLTPHKSPNVPDTPEVYIVLESSDLGASFEKKIGNMRHVIRYSKCKQTGFWPKSIRLHSRRPIM